MFFFLKDTFFCNNHAQPEAKIIKRNLSDYDNIDEMEHSRLRNKYDQFQLPRKLKKFLTHFTLEINLRILYVY